MTAPNNQGVQQYAFDRYREQGGGSLMSVLTLGVSDVVAATKAISAANEAQALSVDPHLVDTMIKKLTEMKNGLSRIQQDGLLLSADTKLGGGYAEQISQANRTLGEQAQKLLVDANRAIDELKTQIEKSRASYQNVEDARANTFKKL